MTAGPAWRRSEAAAISRLERALGRRRPLPSTVLWRWRWEVAGLALASAAGYAAVAAVGPVAAALLGLLLAGGALAVPALRRFLAVRAWAVVTPHRIRVACVQARVHSQGGRLPSVLLTRGSARGERVLLYCPAGTSAEDFASVRPLLRAACWAQDVRVVEHPRRAHLVTLVVVRRAEPSPSAGSPRTGPARVAAAPPVADRQVP